jgi:RNA polymerase sigma-70 factor (ECF subfamily)
VADEFQKLSDEQVARRAQAGEWAGFDELVRRFEARIYRFVLNCCGHAVDARELTQETFVTAYQHLHQFDASRSLTTWLFTIARRKCIDRGRRARPVCEDELPELPDTDDPATLLDRREAAQDLWRRARGVLSEAQFQVLWLRYAEDLSVREVARVVRKTQPHVKVLLFRARRVLAQALKQGAAEERMPADRAGVAPPNAALPAAGLATPTVPRSL